MKQIKIWIEAIRLRTLPVSVSGVLIAVGLAKFNGQFRLLPSLMCVVFAVLAQIVSNLANEYFDFKAGTDKKGRVGPRRGVTEGDITPSAMKCAMIGTLVVACLVGLSMLLVVEPGEGYRNWLMLIGAGILIAIFAFAYSAGPYPLSYHALGEVAVMGFYGLVPVIFTYYVVSGGVFHPFAVIAGIAIGFMGVNVLLVNNYRDVDDDREAGKRTSVVVFGRKLAALAYLVNGLLAMSVLGVVKALIGILGNGIGGVIIDRYGVITLTTAVGIIAATLTALFLVTCLLGRFVWKIPYISEKEKTA